MVVCMTTTSRSLTMTSLYRCMTCGCEVGGVQAALRATCDGCPMCGDPNHIDSADALEQSPPTQEMPVVWVPDDDETPF
jgi:DNA-directed RNA polymerase subunit RPC12/RpoP